MPDPDSNILVYLALLVLLIAVNAYFAMSEIAIIGLNDARLKKQAEDGDKKSRRLLRLLEIPSRFLSTIQVGVTLSGLLASAVAADTFAGPMATALAFTGLSYAWLRTASLVVITILLSFFTLVFGELVPKRIAMKYPEKVAYAVCGSLAFLAAVEKPFVLLLSKTTDGIVRLFGINPHDDPEEVTEEEIRMMVDVGNERGVIEESDREMINNIFEFDDRTAEDVMTHRTEILGVEADEDTLDDVLKIAVEEGFSRIPVYEDTLDDIVGVLYAKDLLPYWGKSGTEELKIRDLMRPALYVPESNRCKDLFREFQEKKVQMAVVVDEYGGTSGIVTMEDLLESIVGNIQDEYDDEEEEVSRISDGVFTIDGSIDLEEVSRLLEIEIPEDTDCDTLGGLITDILGRIPGEDEHPSVTVDGVEFTVMQVEDRRIARVRAEKKLPEPPAEENQPRT
ncbi:MAG: hemolysin family protein [Oscillospiraceae bacterium]|nr:hemolysin family protein [Oscillospiraceae bacterium]